MLSAAVDAYLARRRAAGFQLRDHEGMLRDFARFAAAKGDALVRARTVLEWVRARDGSALRRCVRLWTVVHWARFLQAEDARHEVPPPDAVGRPRPRRRPPFLFTPQEVNTLVRDTRVLGPEGSLPPLVYSTLFGLLAATGLRISEALNLRTEDVTPEGSLSATRSSARAASYPCTTPREPPSLSTSGAGARRRAPARSSSRPGKAGSSTRRRSATSFGASSGPPVSRGQTIGCVRGFMTSGSTSPTRS